MSGISLCGPGVSVNFQAGFAVKLEIVTEIYEKSIDKNIETYYNSSVIEI